MMLLPVASGRDWAPHFQANTERCVPVLPLFFLGRGSCGQREHRARKQRD